MAMTLLCFISDLQALDKSKTNFKEFTLDAVIDSTHYKLPDYNIVAFSESVMCNDQKLFRDSDYTIDYINGTITFLQPDKLSKQISITYYTIPDFLTQKFYQYELQEIQDSLFTTTGFKKRQILFTDDSRLIVTGSKTFSLTFSNQQSYGLKQSLFLQLDGELSDNMKIEGRLSDSETPLTPEGDSREISSLDQVYLKLYGKQYEVTFGDQEYEFTRTDLMKYKARFEGINLAYYDEFGLQGAYAVNGGKTEINIIQGIEGKQGPYFLTTSNGGQTLLIIAGSDRVSVNGEIYNRGEDYTIDYSEGSLLFKRLITSNSRIVVNFQYSDDFYRQNLYLNSTWLNITPSLSISQHLIKQTDSKENPLLYTFTEADLDSLSSAGDQQVWGQGIFEVDPGTGLYIEKVDAQNNTYYEYAAEDSTANYLIYFTYVGTGKGDYEPFGSNKYEYMGKGQGSWLPVKKLVSPTDKTNLGLNLIYNTETWELKAEGVFTNQDKNTFSANDDSDNQSFIANTALAFNPKGIRFNPRFKLSYIQKGENSFSFINLTPDNELYEFSSIPTYDSSAQNQFDVLLNFSDIKYWNQGFSFRYKQVRDKYSQKFIKNETSINQFGFYPSLMWYGIFSSQAFSDSLLESSNLQYHNIDSSWKWKALTLKTQYLLQREDFKYNDADTLSTLEGILFTKLYPTIQISDDNTYSTSVSYTSESNYRKLFSEWENLSTFQTWQFNQLLNKQYNTLNMSITHRESDYPNSEQNSESAQNQKYDLYNVKSSHQLWDNSISLNTTYQVNRLEFFPKIKELQYVGNGIGSYDVDSVYVINGDYDFMYTTSGTGQLATEINANLSFFYHLSPKYLQKSFWHRFHLDSNFQLTNNTTDKGDWRLYLLFPEDFFASDSTKFGRKFMQHNLWIDLWKNVVTGILRYEVTNTLDNRYQEFSKTYNEIRELELDWKQIRGYKLQTSYQNSIERNTRYDSEIKTNELSAILFRNFSAAANLQLATSYQYENGNSSSQEQPYTVSSFSINPSATVYLKNKYRITSSFSTQFNRRNGSDLLSFLPEKRNGVIYNWSVQTQYRLNSFTSGVFEYSGKSFPDEDVLHELKMEFRAEL